MSGKGRWNDLYAQVPLTSVPQHYARMTDSEFLKQYLAVVLEHCPRGGTALETGVGSGYGSVWLSKRGCVATGIDYSPEIVERTRRVDNILGGSARFDVCDLFRLTEWADGRRYDVIHHQGVLEHFTVPQIHAALAQQVMLADRVIFSVPSINYPFDPEFGDERLLPLGEWERILSPFDIRSLRYYGDPVLGAREQIVCVLNGRRPTPELLALTELGRTSFLPGISAIVHTRNEAARIVDCLASLKDWADEIIVCDMESDDDTVLLASKFTDNLLAHPRVANFDKARNVSAMRAKHEWIFYLDADERVTPELAEELMRTVAEGPTFDGLLIPFKHHFSGYWLRSMYPGYTAPRLLRNGRFYFNPRLHSGAVVDGTVTSLPPDDPKHAIVHHSFDDFAHYLNKLNRYTDGESENMHRDGHPFHWQNAIHHFVGDMVSYYERGETKRDGVHGFLYAFFSGFYRFEQHAKLFERRYNAGQIREIETQVPASVEGMLEFALHCVRHGPQIVTPERLDVRDVPEAAEIAWCGPVLDGSGYGDESRDLLLALEEAGVTAACQALPWSAPADDIPEDDRAALDRSVGRPVRPGFTQIVHTFGSRFERHPQAGTVIGRTIFETDRLPPEWVQRCNEMDYVWVSTEFNKRTFALAGVNPEKLVVVPQCFDPAPYLREQTGPPARERESGGGFTFLAVFDWTLHKGWDVLLEAFLAGFAGRDDVRLILKVWSSNGYGDGTIMRQASDFVLEKLGIDLAAEPRVRFVFGRLPRPEMIALYRSADCFVLPSRGEGWGRPYMEAMAAGLPTIGTDFGGNLAFMDETNSLLVDCDLVDIPERGWREVGTYKGHRWAEPNAEDLEAKMRFVVEHGDEAREIGRRARRTVAERFSRQAVGELVAAELARVRSVVGAELTRPEPVERVSAPTEEPPRVRWEGAFFNWHSLAHVNREICGRLAGLGIDLSVAPNSPPEMGEADLRNYDALRSRVFAPFAGTGTVVEVRHSFPPRFQKSSDGPLVVVQPWEYGYLPKEWIRPFDTVVDEIWCNSLYVRDVYLRSGVDARKLVHVPLGADTEVFNPLAPPHVFTDEAGIRSRKPSFTFLFVGGTIERKGIDILIDAYLKAFSAFDDVRLVVKDTGTRTVYAYDNSQRRILDLARDTTRPEIVYLDADLPAHRLAGVYTACDCLVQSYRGEGFCLPAVEAMACGLPAIVPDGGPTDDFIDDTVGWRLPAAHKPMPSRFVGHYECVDRPWMFEIAVDDLARAMRRIAAEPEEAEKKGRAAAARVRQSWTWDRTAAIVAERIAELSRRGSPRDADRERSKTRLMPRTNKISLCAIVKNEERTLGDCLASIAPYVDEIVVVDTGSTDRTVEIAEEHGAKVVVFPWTESFSEARNISLQYATGDWILWMDADDTIPAECGERLRAAVAMAEDSVYGLMMQVRIPPAPGQVGLTVVDHVKLFRNGLGIEFEGRIHEQILEPIYRAGGEIRRTDLYVVHSGYDYSPEGQKNKRKRDLRLLELDLAERPGHPFVLFNIGMTAFHMKDFAKAVPVLEECLKVSEPNESTVRKVYAMLAGAAHETDDLAGARRRIDEGLSRFPRDPELLFRAGVIYRDTGDLQKAEECYIRLLTQREVGHIDSIDETMTGFKAHHNLAIVYREMGNLEGAERHFEAAVQLAPDFVPAAVGLDEVRGRRQMAVGGR